MWRFLVVFVALMAVSCGDESTPGLDVIPDSGSFSDTVEPDEDTTDEDFVGLPEDLVEQEDAPDVQGDVLADDLDGPEIKEADVPTDAVEMPDLPTTDENTPDQDDSAVEDVGSDCGEGVCGGTCGACPEGLHCVSQVCVEPVVLDASYTITSNLDVPFLLKFTEVTGNLRVEATDIEALVLPRLVVLGGTFSVDADSSLRVFEAPSLAVVGGGVSVTSSRVSSLILPSITDIKEHLSPNEAVLDAPLLKTVGSISLASDSQGNLPSLETVASSLSVYGGITEVRLPRLVSVGGLRIRNCTSLAVFDAPALVEGGGVEMRNLSSSLNFILPALATVSGTLQIIDNPGLLSISLPGLTSVQGDQFSLISRNARLESFDLPVLSDIEAIQVWDNAVLTEIVFPSIPSTGVVDVRLNPKLLMVNFPRTTEILYWLTISKNKSLTSLGFPFLTRVGSNFQVQNNAMLPQCLVDVLVAQLRATGGLLEPPEIFDNNPRCTCEVEDGEIRATCL